MKEKQIKLPGPDHPISIQRNPSRVVVSVAGRVVADTLNALTLREAAYPPVQYIPGEDVDFSQLERTDHATYCPYKGDCSYYSIPAGGEKSVNAVWSYQDPFPPVGQIKGHVAFYPERVDEIEQLPGEEVSTDWIPHSKKGRRKAMNLTGNTVFITGGGSGIGRGLAEALHRLGNQVIISGRRKGHLEATTKANPGMRSVELNVEDPGSIASVSKRLIADYPNLNVLINNAGIMQPDDAADVIDDSVLTSTITTNLLGPIRLTSALIEHLKKQKRAAVIYNTSVLGYVPLAMTAVYSSTKAALHTYTLSQRYKLRGTSVSVLEIVPP